MFNRKLKEKLDEIKICFGCKCLVNEWSSIKVRFNDYSRIYSLYPEDKAYFCKRCEIKGCELIVRTQKESKDTIEVINKYYKYTEIDKEGNEIRPNAKENRTFTT